MFDLTETGPAPAFPVETQTLSSHLRLGEGFGDPSAEADLLALYIRTATAHLEARTGLAFVARSFSLTVGAWDRCGTLVLPVGPVTAITSASIEADGTTTVLDPADLHVAPGSQRQRLTAAGGGPLPPIPPGGRASLAFSAGFGGATAVPGDLAKAVLLLAAHFYENRSGTESGLPPAVAALIAPHRPVRL